MAESTGIYKGEEIHNNVCIGIFVISTVCESKRNEEEKTMRRAISVLLALGLLVISSAGPPIYKAEGMIIRENEKKQAMKKKQKQMKAG